MYYLRARYYDPTTGRFTQQDPAEDGYNWYVYGNQNPVMYVDPNGESTAATIGGAILVCVGNGLISGTTYKINGKRFGAGFVNGFVSCLGTEVGIAVGATAGPYGVYAGTIIGNVVGSAIGSMVEDLLYNSQKSSAEIAKSAAKSAAWGLTSGVSAAYWKYAINLANVGGSAAQTLMKYDKKMGEAIKIFFDQLNNILSSQ